MNPGKYSNIDKFSDNPATRKHLGAHLQLFDRCASALRLTRKNIIQADNVSEAAKLNLVIEHQVKVLQAARIQLEHNITGEWVFSVLPPEEESSSSGTEQNEEESSASENSLSVTPT